MADATRGQWCFCWLADRGKAVGAERAALLKAAVWPAGSRIKIAFLDGDPSVQTRVRDAARQWTTDNGGPAALTFDFALQAVDVPRGHHGDEQGDDERDGAHRKQPRAHLAVEHVDFLLMPAVGHRLQRRELIEDLQHRIPLRYDAAAQQRRCLIGRLGLLGERDVARGPVVGQLRLQARPMVAFDL